MRRYWLFICPTYYPGGGMKDYYNSYETIEAAKEGLSKLLKGAEEETLTWDDDMDRNGDLLDAAAHIWDSFGLKTVQWYTEYSKTWSPEPPEVFFSRFPKERF